MIGEWIESHPPMRVTAILFFMIAGLMTLGFTLGGKPEGLPAAIPFFGVALGAWVCRERFVAFRLEEDGIEFEVPPLALDYDDIEMVIREEGGTKSRFAIQIQHRKGVVRIPADLNFSSRDVFDELLERVPPVSHDPLPPSLRQFHDEQTEKFGSERVFAFIGRQFPAARGGNVAAGALMGGAIGALFMALVGAVVASNRPGVQKDDAAGWIGAGMLIGLLSLLFWLLVRRPGSRATVLNAALVVSPTGIALVQGKLKGKMRWDEVKAVEYPPKKRFADQERAKSKNGIGLAVAGAYILILDVYHRPTFEVVQVIRAYARDE